MRTQTVRARSRALLGYLALAACSPVEVNASDEAIARAERIYTACVEDELGLELESLVIARNGDIDVTFAEGYTGEELARAEEVCEPRIQSVLEPHGPSLLGPPANLGRPASDAELNALLASRAKLGFQGAVLVETAGERRLTAGFGQLSARSRQTPDARTAFDCGSIMKDVTATLVFLLEEDGMLSRQQRLEQLFDDVPAVWRSVTVEQVLTHEAGFDAYHDLEGDFEVMDRSTALARIFAQRPLFPPGTETAYSNSGYTLLAALIEQVTGADFRRVARERVFEPLGMERTGFYGDALWDDGNVALGRGLETEGDNDPSRWSEPSWALMGNGGLVSTLDDLLRLAKALDGDVLLQPGTRAALQATRVAGSIAEKPLLGAAGGNDYGFNALVAQVPVDGTYVIAASHVLSPVTAEILALELLQALYGDVVVETEAP